MGQVIHINGTGNVVAGGDVINVQKPPIIRNTIQPGPEHINDEQRRASGIERERVGTCLDRYGSGHETLRLAGASDDDARSGLLERKHDAGRICGPHVRIIRRADGRAGMVAH